MNVLEKKENKLLNRNELMLELTETIIPSKSEITKQISKKTKKPEENIVIGKVDTQFGSHTFKVSAKIYDDLESKEKYETISRKERKKRLEQTKKATEEAKKAEEDAKKESEKPEEKKEGTTEAPKEEVKEEPKVEEKKEEVKEEPKIEEPTTEKTEETKE